jgi:hypothetical protein
MESTALPSLSAHRAFDATVSDGAAARLGGRSIIAPRS